MLSVDAGAGTLVGLLEEHQALLTTEPHLKPLYAFLMSLLTHTQDTGTCPEALACE